VNPRLCGPLPSLVRGFALAQAGPALNGVRESIVVVFYIRFKDFFAVPRFD